MCSLQGLTSYWISLNGSLKGVFGFDRVSLNQLLVKSDP